MCILADPSIPPPPGPVSVLVFVILLLGEFFGSMCSQQTTVDKVSVILQLTGCVQDTGNGSKAYLVLTRHLDVILGVRPQGEFRICGVRQQIADESAAGDLPGHKTLIPDNVLRGVDAPPFEIQRDERALLDHRQDVQCDDGAVGELGIRDGLTFVPALQRDGKGE